MSRSTRRARLFIKAKTTPSLPKKSQGLLTTVAKMMKVIEEVNSQFDERKEGIKHNRHRLRKWAKVVSSAATPR